MFAFEEDHRLAYVTTMLEQMEDIYADLRLEYLEMAKSYDDAMGKISALEADKIFLEEQLDVYIQERKRR